MASPAKNKPRLAQITIGRLKVEGDDVEPLAIQGGALYQNMAIIYKTFDVIEGKPALAFSSKDRRLPRLCGVPLLRCKVIKEMKDLRTRASRDVVMAIGEAKDPVGAKIAMDSPKKRALAEFILKATKDYPDDIPDSVHIDLPRSDGGHIPLTSEFCIDGAVPIKVVVDAQTLSALVAEIANSPGGGKSSAVKQTVKGFYHQAFPLVRTNKDRNGAPFVLVRQASGKRKYHQYNGNDANAETAADEKKIAVCAKLMEYFNEHNVAADSADEDDEDASDAAGGDGGVADEVAESAEVSENAAPPSHL